ncbi:MAG: hypothetical protein ACREO5_09790 [Candidatus Binatia bacterium]
MCSDGVNESAARYARLRQVDAAGRVRDLEPALAVNRFGAQTRGRLARRAHDLRGRVGVVKNVTAVLNDERVSEADRADFRMMLQSSVTSLHALLDDLIVLSRLEAGHE